MQHALALAAQAGSLNEVPVGAVLVHKGVVIGEGYNQMISASDPTAHAECVALRAAARSQHNYRLPGCTLYVTLEPCTMCVGALIHARIERLVFATREPRAGAIVSQQQVLDQDYYNHQIQWSEGVLAEESTALLKAFFKARRKA